MEVEHSGAPDLIHVANIPQVQFSEANSAWNDIPHWTKTSSKIWMPVARNGIGNVQKWPDFDVLPLGGCWIGYVWCFGNAAGAKRCR